MKNILFRRALNPLPQKEKKSVYRDFFLLLAGGVISLFSSISSTYVANSLNERKENKKNQFARMEEFNKELVSNLSKRSNYELQVFYDLGKVRTATFINDSTNLEKARQEINNNLYYYDINLTFYYSAYVDTELFEKGIYRQMLKIESAISSVYKGRKIDSTIQNFFYNEHGKLDSLISDFSSKIYEEMYASYYGKKKKSLLEHFKELNPIKSKKKE